MKATITVLREPGQDKQTTGRLDAVRNGTEHMNFLCLERPWLNNQKGVSCIPIGIYPWEKVLASRHIPYPHIAIQNVPGRDGVCIHIGNYVTNVEGCIIIGLSFVDINKDGLQDLTDSTVAFHKLMEFLPDSGTIEIKNANANA